MKKVLILCTGNSCRSILAEALINTQLEGISAESSGVKASGMVNPYAKALLIKEKLWKSEYHSKTLDTLIHKKYDLIVTVCDHAKETCPTFPSRSQRIHIGLKDPDGLGMEAFEYTLERIKIILLPQIKALLR
ncbi:Arsenate reductase [hydrothermal vent metagenome]|uniref:Arsenate reductase n=1 Tax=hydrothermal vent metagenome TaxID=652676 RepID=A0A1W1CQC0_9ZZZZ